MILAAFATPVSYTDHVVEFTRVNQILEGMDEYETLFRIVAILALSHVEWRFVFYSRYISEVCMYHVVPRKRRLVLYIPLCSPLTSL